MTPILPPAMELCPGSGILIQYSSPELVPGMPACCPRCGGLTRLAADRDDVPPGYAVAMYPEHEREVRQP